MCGFNYDGTALTAIAKINFLALASTQYGAQVATGDVEGDGYDELAAATGPGPSLVARCAGFDFDGDKVVRIERPSA